MAQGFDPLPPAERAGSFSHEPVGRTFSCVGIAQLFLRPPWSPSLNALVELDRRYGGWNPFVFAAIPL